MADPALPRPANTLYFPLRTLALFLIYVLGLWAPWTRFSGEPVTLLWLVLSSQLVSTGWMGLQYATNTVTICAILLAFFGAILRVWGSARLSAAAEDRGFDKGRSAASPVRLVRSPLYIGALLFALSVTILMPPTGALAFLIAVLLFSALLVPADERALRVSSMPPAKPSWRWGHAVFGELFLVSFTVCLAVFAWRFNAQLLIRCLFICFGVSLIARALLPADTATS